MATEGGAAGEGGAGAEGAAAGGEAAAAAAAASAAGAAGAAAAAGGGAAVPKPKTPKPAPFDQQPGFRKRVDEEAMRVLRRKLGVSIEEATALIARAKAIPDGGAAGAGANPGAAAAASGGTDAAALVKEVQKLTAKVTSLSSRVERQKAVLQKKTRNHRLELIESEIKHEILAAGVKPNAVNYALGLYRDANAGKTAEQIVAVGKFFGGLKKTEPYLFSKPGEVAAELDPTITAPESEQPGEDTPAATAAGGGAPVVDVDKMSPQEFSAYKKRKYGG